MTNKEEKSSIPAPSPKGDEALRQKSKLFPIESVRQNIPPEEIPNDLQEQLKGLALPKSAFDQFNAAMKPQRDIQKQLAALAPPKNSFTKLEAAMKPQKNLQEQLTEIKEPRELGKLIRKRRGVNGMSQQQLADLAGVGRRFLSELENGKQSLEFGKVLRVASAIGIDLLAKQR